ncbi:MAG: CBS domain-containing protein [Caldilineaceae bacterium]
MRRHLTEVRDWMTDGPVTIAPQLSLYEAYNRMIENDIRRLPVVDRRGNLLGIITLSDVVKTAAFTRDSAKVESDLLANSQTVAAIMTEAPITVAPDDTIQEAAEVMLENQVSGLPVVDGARVVGIITESDIFRLVVESWASMEVEM